MFTRLIIAVIVVGTPTAGAAAQVARSVDSDVRCLVATTAVYQGVTDAKVKQDVLGGALFYFGRLDGRFSDAELEARLVRQAGQLKSADLDKELEVCGAYLSGRGERLQAIGQKIMQAGK